MTSWTPTQCRYVVACVLLAAAWVFACDNPQPPELCGSVPEQTITVGESVTVSLCFDDPNGEMLDHRVVSSDPAVATAVATGSTVTVTAVSPGLALVTMIVTDPTGLKAQQSFRVVVPNRPPTAVGTIPDRELMVGDSATLDVTGFFSEPDGQGLDYAVAVSDSSRLTTAVEAATVTIVAVAKGDVVVTVTATDPGGLSATQSFVVTVPNRPPVPVDSIAARIVDAGRADTVDVAPFFTDPDGDPLSYAAAVSDSAVVSAEVTGNRVVVAGLAKGNAEVTVTATDDEGLSAEQRFQVTVPNRPPIVADTIPDRTLFKDEADTLVLARHFTDPDGDVLTWDAEASDSGVVALEVSAAAGTLAITAVGQGEATVTVTATDQEGLSAEQRFLVTVPNRGPVVADEIPAQSLYKRETVPLELGPYFSDPDADALTYAAETTDSTVVVAEVEDAMLVMKTGAQGEAELTVTATDPAGLSASQSFTVTVVNRAPTVITPIPEQTIGLGAPGTIDLSLHFADPDGDRLEYAATSSDRVVRVSVRESTLTLRARDKGIADVTVTATDTDDFTVEQTFTVTVANQAPTAVGRFPELTISRDENLTFPISRYFSDPDRDPLTHTGTTADPGIARASVSGTTLTLTGVTAGETTLTLIATDPEGLMATMTSQLKVVGQGGGAPFPVGTIPDQTISERVERTLSVSLYFRDPNGDALQYRATTGNSTVATASASGSRVTVRGVSTGETTLSVTATDPDGRSTAHNARIVVVGPGSGPVATGAIPGQNVESGRTNTLYPDPYFQDPDDGSLVFSATSSDTRVVIATGSGNMVQLTGVATGQATVTITATDSDGLSATQTARVSVGRTGQGPETVGTVDDASLDVGEELTVEMDTYFRHPSGDPLAYMAGTSDPTVASAAMTGTTLTITAQRVGTGTITIVATDPGGRSATQRFAVTVAGGGGGGGGGESGFNIRIQYHSSATDAVKSAVGGAAAGWESILSATDFADGTLNSDQSCSIAGVTFTAKAGTVVDDLVIAVAVATLDGARNPGVVARAGICLVRTESQSPAFGAIVFDEADLGRLESSGVFGSVAIHEIGHVLGIGLSSSWWSSVRDDPDPHFAGTLATAAFDDAGGSGYSGAKVPLASDRTHWRESVLGDEVMTPGLRSSGVNPLSAITIQALADMGYSVDATLADAFTLSFGDAADIAGPVHTIDLHGDFERGPIKVIDRDGNVVRVIPGDLRQLPDPQPPPAQAQRTGRR
ncbi:MAG: hypothetical protein OXH66_17545 [Gemmatimonadetes bacterium]|nr:hypothetical protein [Gemmatimonadota bacterium]